MTTRSSITTILKIVLVYFPNHLSGKSIYVDGKWTASFLLRLMNRFSANYQDASLLITKLRAIKDEQEIKSMIKASLDNDEVMRRILPYQNWG